MEPTIVQVDSLKSLEVLPDYIKDHDLTNAQFFRFNVGNGEGLFAIITEVACLKDCYFSWRLIIEKTKQPKWPKAHAGPPNLSDTDVAEIFYLVNDELARYQSGDVAIGNERVTTFEHFEKPQERMAWCLKKCEGMPWVDIKTEAEVNTEKDT